MGDAGETWPFYTAFPVNLSVCFCLLDLFTTSILAWLSHSDEFYSAATAFCNQHISGNISDVNADVWSNMKMVET